MSHLLQRIGVLLLACLMLMSFKLEPVNEKADRLIYDVRGAFVAAKPDVSHGLMQIIHEQVSDAIAATTRERMRPRVVLTIRLASVNQFPFLFGQKATARVIVRAASVSTGEVIAEAKFTATIVGLDRSALENELAYGVADRVIREFRLERPAPTSLATALFP